MKHAKAVRLAKKYRKQKAIERNMTSVYYVYFANNPLFKRYQYTLIRVIDASNAQEAKSKAIIAIDNSNLYVIDVVKK